MTKARGELEAVCSTRQRKIKQMTSTYSEGRHVNIQMRALKAAWEAHKREVHQQ